MSTIRDTVISQFANSPRMLALIDDVYSWISPDADLDLFYTQMWNINTAVGAGLDVLGSIVGITRNVRIPSPGELYFGFSESYGCQPFGQAPFFNGHPVYIITTLDDTTFRKLILLKSLSNITICSAENLNKILQAIYGGEGKAYVIDAGNMQMFYVFEFLLSPTDLSILTYSRVLITPTGVKVQLVQVDAPTTFGFSGSGLQPFGQGVFYEGASHVA